MSRRDRRSASGPPKACPLHIVIVLGSGGHTAEMISLLRDLNPTKYSQRTYIISSGDKFSETKAVEYERIIQLKYKNGITEANESGTYDDVTGVWNVKTVPRARRIHQPLYTAPLSCLGCLLGCLQLLYNSSNTSQAGPSVYPDVIVTNGPATAVIVVLASLILRFFAIVPLWKMKTVYVESWARVKTLSLSGKLLLHLGVCDRFLVQWEGLADSINKKSKRRQVEWVGFLVE